MSDRLALLRPPTLRPSGPQLERAMAEYELQTGVMVAQQQKADFGQTLITDLYRRGMLSVREAMDFFIALDTTTEYREPYGQMFRDFNVGFMSDYFDSVMKITRVGVGNIMLEAGRDLYLPPVPPSQPGLFVRILTAIVGEGKR